MRVAGDCRQLEAGLLCRDDGILAGLGHAKLHNGLCLDLDCFAGGGVAAGTGFARYFHELAETGHRELAFFLGFLIGDVRKRVKKIVHVLFGNAKLFRRIKNGRH